MNGVRYTFGYAQLGYRPVLSLNEGTSAIAKNIGQRLDKIKGRTAEGLREAGELILDTAVVLCPKDTYALAESKFLRIIHRPSGPIAEIGFGRYGAPAKIPGRKLPSEYAVYVHENMEVHHPIGQAKFLEEAMKLKATEALAIIRKRAKR